MQERESAMRSCTGLMQSRKKVMQVGSSFFWHMCCQYIIWPMYKAIVIVVVSIFQPISSILCAV